MTAARIALAGAGGLGAIVLFDRLQRVLEVSLPPDPDDEIAYWRHSKDWCEGYMACAWDIHQNFEPGSPITARRQ